MAKKLEQAKEILEVIGMPVKQQSDICCYTLLALANISSKDKWSAADNEWIRIHDILEFIKLKYKIVYAENSRETVRKQCLHHFREAAIIEDNGLATNSPNYRYRLTVEARELLRSYITPAWELQLESFLKDHERLVDKYASKKKMEMQPVSINGNMYNFSTGKHNVLQKAIIEDFAPRFAPNSRCLYVGDTIKKDLVKDVEKLKELGFEITLHDKMPDVILYCEDKKWLYFIEAVTSVGPMSPKRVIEIQRMTEKVMVGKIYITAFLDMATYRKFVNDIAWDTEIWIAEMPDHMIHMNGDRFMGPRDNK